jgi:hypothetical protein
VRKYLLIMPSQCLVICPLHQPFDEYDREIFQPAIQDAGLTPLPAGDIFSPGTLMRDAVAGIVASAIVLADLTGKDPNVFYQAGLAHAYGKPVIMLAQEKNSVPSDLQALKWIYYETRSVHWGRELQRSISDTIAARMVAAPAERARQLIPERETHATIADRIVGLSPTQRRIFDLLKRNQKPMDQRELESLFQDRSAGEIFYRLETMRLQGLVAAEVMPGSGVRLPLHSYRLSEEASAYYHASLRT